MRRSPRHLAAPPDRRGGLALPTLLSAVVCGSSVLAIAVTGSFALDAGGNDVQTFAKVITSVTGSGMVVPRPESVPVETAPLPPAATAPDRTLHPLP
ncbi:MAG: hypothetical protein QG622_1961 [Actinomycetota bacterium]|nr:hypothetical protein [Actinomycetota bacterium]